MFQPDTDWNGKEGSQRMIMSAIMTAEPKASNPFWPQKFWPMPRKMLTVKLCKGWVRKPQRSVCRSHLVNLNISSPAVVEICRMNIILSVWVWDGTGSWGKFERFVLKLLVKPYLRFVATTCRLHLLIGFCALLNRWGEDNHDSSGARCQKCGDKLWEMSGFKI